MATQHFHMWGWSELHLDSVYMTHSWFLRSLYVYDIVIREGILSSIQTFKFGFLSKEDFNLIFTNSGVPISDAVN